GYRVGNCRTLSAQDLVSVNCDASDFEIAGELRSVPRLNFEEDHLIARRDVIVVPFLLQLFSIFARVAAITAVGHDADRSLNLIDNAPRSIVENNAVDAQLCCWKGPRGERDDDNRRNKE